MMVAVLFRLGLYGYGFEKSYSRRALRAMVERARLDVVAETGILFIPGWLRMFDLLSHTRRWTRLERLTARAVGVFASLGGSYPALRRHGYLIACVATKPLPSAVDERNVVDPIHIAVASRGDVTRSELLQLDAERNRC
jgi:hypothetical protein